MEQTDRELMLHVRKILEPWLFRIELQSDWQMQMVGTEATSIKIWVVFDSEPKLVTSHEGRLRTIGSSNNMSLVCDVPWWRVDQLPRDENGRIKPGELESLAFEVARGILEKFSNFVTKL